MFAAAVGDMRSGTCLTISVWEGGAGGIQRKQEWLCVTTKGPTRGPPHNSLLSWRSQVFYNPEVLSQRHAEMC